jgi:virginiamycin B lyase
MAVARQPPASLRDFDDDHHFVWLSVWTANALVCFDMLPLPYAHANVRPMMGPPAEVWLSESGIDHLARYRSAASENGSAGNGAR